MPVIPIVNLPFLYVNNLQISNNATTPNTKIDVAAGQCRDSTNTVDLVGAALTIDATTNGLNGLDSGDLAASTWYAVHEIGASNSNSPTGAMLSTSATAPQLTAAGSNYDVFRRIGWVKTDGSSHLLKFVLSGNNSIRYYQWDALIAVLSAGSQTSFTAQSLAAGMPLQATPVYLSAAYTPNNAANTAQLRPTGSSVAEDSAPVIISGAVASVAMKTGPFKFLPKLATGNPSLDYLVQASDALTLNVIAFEDFI